MTSPFILWPPRRREERNHQERRKRRPVRDQQVADLQPRLNNETRARFESLVSWWRTETSPLSSLHDIILHPAYQQIIGMGESALPYLLTEMATAPDHWGWALRAITGEDPVPPEDAGQLDRVAKHWLEWARRAGIEPKE